MHVSAVFAIQTQGRGIDQYLRWAYTYRVEYSEDCNTFNKVLNVATGLNQVRSFADRFCVYRYLHQVIKIKLNVFAFNQFMSLADG